MKQGGWETAQSYRDLIRNKDEAISLEQQGRVVKDIHMIERQLGELNSQYEQQPESVDLVRKIAHLCDQKYQITETGEDLETSVTWYRYLTDLTKGADPAIARKFSDLELKRKDHDIKKLEDWFGEGGDQHEEAAPVSGGISPTLQARAGRGADQRVAPPGGAQSHRSPAALRAG